MNSILSVEDLSFNYHDRPVLKDINLDISKETINLILGANGAGKSTLLKLASGLLIPQRGRVLFLGDDVTTLNKRFLSRKIAYVSQESLFSFPFSVLEIVLLGRSPYIGRFEFENDPDFKIALDALDMIEISHLKNRLISEVSGGERQLVSIARAIAQDPDIMILDEPGTFLDLKHKSQIYNSFERIKKEKGISVIIATHDINSIKNEFDNIILLKDGMIFKHGKVHEIINESNLSQIYGIDVRLHKFQNNIFIATGPIQ